MREIKGQENSRRFAFQAVGPSSPRSVSDISRITGIQPTATSLLQACNRHWVTAESTDYSPKKGIARELRNTGVD